MVGFWYNKDLFAQAGIDAPAGDVGRAARADVQKLKDAGITPIAVGAGDKWPAHFWYSYLMVRLGGADAMNQIAADNNFNVPERDRRRREGRRRSSPSSPFQAGFLGAGWDAPDGESGTMASGGAAMDLMGQWAPGAFQNQAGVEPDEDLPFELGWFPFPSVEGGAGAATDAFGGGDGFAVGKDAPPEAVDFLDFITNAAEPGDVGEEQRPAGQHGGRRRRRPTRTCRPCSTGSTRRRSCSCTSTSSSRPRSAAAVNDQTATALRRHRPSPEDAAAAITAVGRRLTDRSRRGWEAAGRTPRHSQPDRATDTHRDLRHRRHDLAASARRADAALGDAGDGCRGR